ncbi:hypothetical protein [Paraburkholderia sp. J8-2]|uniref:hypothetical protein n=1 Tax=Paraburkholderia sp. J8-2 TaxID=2805440 RepID=UPI002AB67DB8|nr:hypothetical protein [Paraburkholderia sp. J8-2]
MAHDSWCDPIVRGGRRYSGAVAREIRIKEARGMDTILATAIEHALQKTLDDVNLAVSKAEPVARKSKPGNLFGPKTQ